jgi:NAD(P)-dependent dehydrogenase (short-subunit alcohol dehydrogenase family)
MAVELRHAGPTVYVSRTTREGRSPMNRPEIIEETAELVTEAGGRAIAVRTDHSDPAQVEALIDRIRVSRTDASMSPSTTSGADDQFIAFLAERGQTFSEWVEQMNLS